MRDPEAEVFGYAPNLDMFDPLTFIYQHGGRIFDDLQNPSQTTFDDPLNIEALDWYTKLIFDYNVAPTPEQLSEAFGPRGGIQAGIYRGQIAMWTGMLSERGGRRWPTEWDMRWGMVPLPSDSHSATLTMVEGLFISSQAPHPDACWEWIAFLSSRVPARQAPARRSLAESAEYEQSASTQVAAVVRSSMENALMLSPKLAEFEEALGLFSQAFESILNESASPQEAMSWAQQQSKYK
jgi:ABC-type glycerol-3-phosphate transport system substrate-binding protein